MKPINKILSDMREDRDIRQNVIAKLLDISQQQYSRYETGESEFPLRAAVTLADYYGVSLDYLTGRKDMMSGVPGLDKRVTKEQTAGEVLHDILSLDADGREAVTEYIFLQKLKQKYGEKEKGSE